MKKVRDPIHNYIRLEDAALRLADAAPLQRLRRVHQLGTASLVYPGANHTRFEHALGAYHLARLATRSLELDGGGLEVRLAALLHDVGHGPFSHLSEALMRHHLGTGHAEVSARAARAGPIADALRDHGADPRRVSDLILGRGPVGALVAGELDVDRMDYLVRDGHYTGVNTGVDLQRLVDELALAGDGLALRVSGLAAAEALLTTRFIMYGSVYLHHASRVAEVMMERAIDLAIQGGEVAPEELTTMDDVDMVARLRVSDTPARDIMAAVDTRRLHKVAREAPYDAVGAEEAARLSGDREARRALEAEVAAAAGVDPVRVIVDVPPPPMLPEGGLPVLDPDGTLTPIRDRSQLVAALSRAYLDHWCLRVVVPPEARSAAGAVADKLISGQ